MYLQKVGVVYCTFEQLQKKLKGYLSFYNDSNKNTFLTWRVETNKGVNFIIKKTIKKFDNKYHYFDIYGINAAALKKFEFHTNITALSIREYNAIKGGAPYQIFIGE